MILPLKEQRSEMVNSKIYTHFRKHDNTDSDIINSEFYKKLLDNNIIGTNDITITFNSDGISLFKSSKKSMWAILVTINELPYRIRKDNVILCGIWYGKKKPVMNTFLQPFVNELIELEKTGFETTTYASSEPVVIKVHAIVCTVDSVARPMIQNVKQFNE